MAPMPSSEPSRLGELERRQLIDVAWGSIRHGLASGDPAPVNPTDFPPRLCEPGAAFVTLHLHGALRGCVGHLEAIRPLVVDVADNAFAAAFRDPRFQPLEAGELADLSLEVSVLTPAEPLQFESQEDLLAQLRPGVDGVILKDRGARGTFLPAVWDSLPEPHRFLAELKRKAGLPSDHWSDSLKVWRYRTETFGA